MIYFANLSPLFCRQLRQQNKCLVMSQSSLFGQCLPASALPKKYHTVTYVTTPSEDEARRIAKQLVKNRLAACVNIIKGVESIYEWKGKIEKDNEFQLMIKSDSSKTKDLIEFVERNHKYECPEVVTLKVESGSKKYLDWISETVAKEKIED